VAVSGFVFMSMFFYSKIRFQNFWNKVKPHFDIKSSDLEDVIEYYNQNDRKILVMIMAGIVVGVVSIKETDSIGDKKTCKVSRLYVHPNCRRLGVASKLLQAAKIEALKLGYKMLKIETFENNSEMIEFCDKKNFDQSYSETVVDVYPLKFNLQHFEMDLVKSKVFS